MAEEMDFFEAYETALTPLFTASDTLRLVAGAHQAGLIEALRDPSSVDRLSARTGMSTTRVETLCRALVATGVAEPSGDDYVLTRPWRGLTAPGGYVSLEVALEGNLAQGRVLQQASGTTYWTMPAEDRLAYALSVSPNPFSDELVAAFAADIARDPDRVAMTAGGRLLELGCGVAGRVLTTLRAVPELTAVGVELSDDLAAAALARAGELGLAGRFDVVCTDAQSFTDPEPFDYGFWSQFFFPTESRAGALRAMHRALRPGAVLLAPLGADYDEVMKDPTSSAARDYALWRVALDSWGVPERTPQALAEEIADAGFTDVRVVPRGGAGPIVRATR